jgi:hypothetical protein
VKAISRVKESRRTSGRRSRAATFPSRYDVTKKAASMRPSSSIRRASAVGRLRRFGPVAASPSASSSAREIASVPLPGAPIARRRPASETSPSVTGLPR